MCDETEACLCCRWQRAICDWNLVFFLSDNVVIYSEKEEFEKLKAPPPKTVKR